MTWTEVSAQNGPAGRAADRGIGPHLHGTTMGHAGALNIEAVNEQLPYLTVEERICWAADSFGEDAVLLSSMQKSACVLMHLFWRMGLNNEILFVDTGYHFRETLQLRDDFMRRYKLNIVTLYPELTPDQQERKYGRKLYLDVDGQKTCCYLRKTAPYLSYMARSGRRLTLSGVRRSEGDRRSDLRPVVPDPRTQGYTLHPIYDWTDEQVETYLHENGVPVHPLYTQGYPSIGCECCTTPVDPGEHPRAGRWRHLRKPDEDGPKYCNILFLDGAGI